MAVRLLLARALRLLPRCRPPCAPRAPRSDPRPGPLSGSAPSVPPAPWRPWLAWLPAARRFFLRGSAGGLAAVARRGRGGVCLALAMALGLVEPRLEEQRRAEAACRHIQVGSGPGIPLGSAWGALREGEAGTLLWGRPSVTPTRRAQGVVALQTCPMKEGGP